MKYYWRYRIALVLFICTVHVLLVKAENIRLDVSGEWMFRLDPENKGMNEKWYNLTFDEYIHLPGALQNQGYGNDISVETPWLTGGGNSSSWYTHPMYSKFREKENLRYPNNFQPEKHYVGVAWYKKKIYIPKEYKGKEILLYLERVHWESTLWINDVEVGKCNSLLSPHVYNLSSFIHLGEEQTITLRVDNGEVVQVGEKAHSWGDQTMTAWNGIIGEMNLRINEQVYLDDLQIYPDIDAKKVRFNYVFNNNCAKTEKITVNVGICSFNTNVRHQIPPLSFLVTVKPGKSNYIQEIDMSDNMLLWSEYTPNLYKADIVLNVGSARQYFQETFGMREISVDNNRFILNGEEIYLRGNVLCGSFPQTGYASMDYSEWKRIMTIHKYYGLNHIRFHSWTPPEAAFKAADEVGIYLYSETNVWAPIRTKEQENFLSQEGALALKYYGNHPSFLFMGMGNETAAKKDITDRLLIEWKKDNRRLYTGLANSRNSISSQCEFLVTREVRSNIGWPPGPQCSYFYRNKPSTDFTFGDPVKYQIPLITHEAGQHCSYPALDQMLKFTGSQFAGYIDIAREQLNEHGMLKQWPDFVKASGKLQSLFYKHELETYLRMPRHTGYEILQIEDFPGQGSALVGVLDYFYDSKGYITAQEFRQFCGPQVLLLKMPKFTWKQHEIFKAEAAFSNWGKTNLVNPKILYQISGDDGTVYFERTFAPTMILRGDAVSLGELDLSLSKIAVPCKLTVKATLVNSDVMNEWSFWVYPDSIPTVKGIAISEEWNDSIAQRIINGENMVIQLGKKNLKRGGDLPPSFLPIFWTQFDKMGNSQTMGILCKPEHNMFEYFPTEYHCNWQWYELLNDAYPIIFDEYGMTDAWDKSFIPLIQLIDGWKTNRKMGVLAEAKMGKGKIVITSMNLTENLEERFVARQFRFSLLNYMKSKAFDPEYQVTPKSVDALLQHGEILREKSKIKNITSIGISSESELSKLMDGDMKSLWSGKLQKRGALILALNKMEQVGSVHCMRAGNKKKWHEISYKIFLSKDGKDWGIPLAQGKLNQDSKITEMNFQYFHGANYVKIEFFRVPKDTELSISEIKVVTE